MTIFDFIKTASKNEVALLISTFVTDTLDAVQEAGASNMNLVPIFDAVLREMDAELPEEAIAEGKKNAIYNTIAAHNTTTFFNLLWEEMQ